jgi:hypothetical protein
MRYGYSYSHVHSGLRPRVDLQGVLVLDPAVSVAGEKVKLEWQAVRVRDLSISGVEGDAVVLGWETDEWDARSRRWA